MIANKHAPKRTFCATSFPAELGVRPGGDGASSADDDVLESLRGGGRGGPGVSEFGLNIAAAAATRPIELSAAGGC